MNLQIKVNSVLALSDPNSDDQHFKRFERKFRKRLKDSKIVGTSKIEECKKPEEENDIKETEDEVKEEDEEEFEEEVEYTIIIQNEDLSPSLLRILFVLFSVVDKVILRKCWLMINKDDDFFKLLKFSRKINTNFLVLENWKI